MVPYSYFSVIGQKTQHVSEQTKLIIGPWTHAGAVKTPGMIEEIPFRASVVIPAIPWFDYHLGLSESLEMPKVKIFVMGDNIWREENEWPLNRTKVLSYYLNSQGSANSATGDGKLSLALDPEDQAIDHYIYNPSNPVPTAGGAMLGLRAGMQVQNSVESREDVLVYTSEVLSQRLEVTGEVIVELYVSTDAPSTDFTAKLVDVYPDGNAYNLSDTILRRSFPVDGGVYKLILSLPPTSNAFHQGHRIRLEVSSSNFPHFDRNPNTGARFDREENSRVARQYIYHSEQYPSRILLPIIPNNN